MSSAPIINALDRALDMLDYIYRQGKEVSVTQISTDLDVYKSTVHRTLATLEAKNYVERNPETGKYSLGMRIFIMGNSIERKTGLATIIKPFAHELHSEFNETVNVSILEYVPGEVPYSIIISKEEGRQGLCFTPSIGTRNEIHSSASGKCLVAFDDSVDLSVFENHVMERYTPNTITNLASLKAEIVKARQLGYAVDAEEREIGLTCIAAPIFNANKHAVAAISISGPTNRMRSDFEKRALRLLAVTAKASLAIS